MHKHILISLLWNRPIEIKILTKWLYFDFIDKSWMRKEFYGPFGPLFLKSGKCSTLPHFFIAKFRSNVILKMNKKRHELVERRLFFDFMMLKLWSDSNSKTQQKVCGTCPKFLTEHMLLQLMLQLQHFIQVNDNCCVRG